jgi:hypothetical protein
MQPSLDCDMHLKGLDLYSESSLIPSKTVNWSLLGLVDKLVDRYQMGLQNCMHFLR